MQTRFKKVFVVCPANLKTGGPELLHQLVYRINLLGGNAYVAYAANSEITDRSSLCHPEFRMYVDEDHICTIDEVEDAKECAVVVPEGWAPQILKIENAYTFLWWLSVDNFKLKLDEEQQKEWLEFLKDRVDVHLLQSQYARDYLLSNFYPEDKLVMLGDYINKVYIDNIPLLESIKKEDAILFNPKKGGEHIEMLAKAAPDLFWVPIINMTSEQVSMLLQRAKVYIDFGEHPGKDRIPREAAISNCIVITNKRGAAAYKEDVDIPEEYKFEDMSKTEEIVGFLRTCLLEFEKRKGDFDRYRQKIMGEEADFIEGVKTVFFVP